MKPLKDLLGGVHSGSNDSRCDQNVSELKQGCNTDELKKKEASPNKREEGVFETIFFP
jgi:hypothetical protein